MSTETSPPPAAELTQAPFTPATREGGQYSRRPYDILGLAWLHGSFQAAIFRREVFKRAWQSPTPVRSLEDFKGALDAALVELRFGGTEVFLILENDAFVHQTEQAPAFSDSAARAYLRGRVERFEKDHSPVLWVSQRTLSSRQESTFLLHLLPSAFYGQINSVLLARRLDLTRIVPLVVPMQLALAGLPLEKDKPVLLAADTGDATTVMAGRGDGEIFFARTMLARWDTDPARIGVEVNRSVLYAKQQFSAVVEKIFLLGTGGEAARTEIQTRCGAGKEVLLQTQSPIDWLQFVAKLTPRHPVNLVAGYLGRKRRQQFIRRIVVAACWLVLTLLGLTTWSLYQDWGADRARLAQLETSRTSLLADRDRLQARNAVVQKEQEFIRQAIDDRLPPVPGRVLAFLASVLPPEAHLSELNLHLEPATAKWVLHIEGQLTADEETGREMLTTFQKQIARSPLQVHFNDAARMIAPIPSPGLEGSTTQRFALEGTLFEN